MAGEGIGARDRGGPLSEAVEVTVASLIPTWAARSSLSRSISKTTVTYNKATEKYLHLRPVHILGRNTRLSLLDVGLCPSAVKLAFSRHRMRITTLTF
jgi:hypothetical protein